MDKVLGMGNALVDIMIKLNSDALLSKFSLPKGGMQLIDKNFVDKILLSTSKLERKQSSGGSAANTIHGLANLGIETGFIGKIGNDDFGKYFKSDMQINNIKPKLFYGKAKTGIGLGLISKDSERTFATYLGAAIELSEDDLNSSVFQGYRYFHIEGYLVQNHDLIEKAVTLAKKNNLLVSLDLASFNVVKDNLDFLKMLTRKYVDIIFANEEEAKVFTGENPEKALNIIAKDCKIAVVKIGEEGSLIKQGNKIFKINSVHSNCIDTTGAGDLYASGFIYGLNKGLPIDKCGEIGSLLAASIIEIIGSKMDDSRWEKVKKMINNV